MKKFYFVMICMDLFFIGYCFYHFLTAVSEVSALGLLLYAILGTIWIMMYARDYKNWKKEREKENQ